MSGEMTMVPQQNSTIKAQTFENPGYPSMDETRMGADGDAMTSGPMGGQGGMMMAEMMKGRVK